MRSRHIVALAALVALCGSSGAAQQQQQQQQQHQQQQQRQQQPGQQPPLTQTPQATFRTSTRLVVQNVIVKDKDGTPVQGLTAKDFVVTEENEPQDIAFVEYQELKNDLLPADAPATV